jgi:hypothetical protein
MRRGRYTGRISVRSILRQELKDQLVVRMTALLREKLVWSLEPGQEIIEAVKRLVHEVRGR